MAQSRQLADGQMPWARLCRVLRATSDERRAAGCTGEGLATNVKCAGPAATVNPPRERQAERCSAPGRPVMATRRRSSFDPKSFLAQVGEGRTISKYRKDQAVFQQGDPADAVFYIQKGKLHCRFRARERGGRRNSWTGGVLR